MLWMLQEVYHKAATKETQFAGREHGRATVNDDPRCGQYSVSQPPWIVSRRAYCKQMRICRNSPSPQRSSEKETSGEMGTKRWFLLHDNAPANQSVVEICLAKHDALEHLTYFPHLSMPDFVLFSRPESVLKAQDSRALRNAKATTVLTEVWKNGFQVCFLRVYERLQKWVTIQGNYFEGNVV
jgi:hypothetical protein